MQSSRSSNTFIVRSKPSDSSNSSKFLIQYVNSISSLFINLSIQRILYQILISTSNTFNSSENQNDTHNDDSFIQNKFGIIVNEETINMLVLLIVAMCFFLYQLTSFARELLVVIGPNRSKRKGIQMTQYVCQVQIVPWGVQICGYRRNYMDIVNQDSNIIEEIDGNMKEERYNQKMTFIPMESIVDVIVVERVMSYKVKSCILFRINEKGSWSNSMNFKNDMNSLDDKQSNYFLKHDEKRNSDITLVEAFSSKLVELTYSECIDVWKGIDDAIKKYK